MMEQEKKEILIGLVIALLVVILLSPLASSHPDGLEKVAEDKNFIHSAEGKELINSPIPDYAVPGLENETLAGILAGVIGTLSTFVIMVLLAKVIGARRKKLPE